jgi:hypothetical protein
MNRHDAYEELCSIIGYVAADPGGEWLNGGDGPTMSQVQKVLDQLAESVRIEVHDASWEYRPVADLYRCVGSVNGRQCDQVWASGVQLPVAQHVRAVLP